MDHYVDVGGYCKPVTTRAAAAQTWVNRGLLHTYGFNHLAAVECFYCAIKEDQNCAMAYWGAAYAFGPHYNKLSVQQSAFDQGQKNLSKAVLLSAAVSDWQQMLIEALKSRYPADFKESDPKIMARALRQAIAAFRVVYEKYPEDLEIAALYAESLMNTNPWHLWSKTGQPTQQAAIARQVLQKAGQKGYHPQICHLYIHLMELSPFIRESLGMADLLSDNIKGIAHLQHMPSHVFIQCGQYQKSLECNARAIQTGFITKKHHPGFSFFQLYRGHDAHFAAWTAMFMADYETAMKYSKLLMQVILPEGLLSQIGNYLEFMVAAELHVMVRFGKWRELIGLPIKAGKEYMLYRVTQRYSRTIAFAVLGQVESAEQELQLFRVERLKVHNRFYSNNTVADVFEVGQALAQGEILYRQQRYGEAFERLRLSVRLSDGLTYDQPWGWMQPPRHALAALLLEQGELEQSEAVYLQDLKTYPANIWSLTGLEQIYLKLGNK